MLEARIRKLYPPGPESAAFELDVAFEAGPGFTVLFGASGSGKTLTLDCLAGFVRPEHGRILLDDALLFDAAARVNRPPRQRRCAYVLQSYALFPHMTLRQNLNFAAAGWPRPERQRRVNEAMARFRLADLAGRRPHELSGGQKQRCSIARALLGGRPSAPPGVLLLDEPAQGLDAPLRNDLYAVLRQVRDEVRIPVLLVTHSLEECFALADRMLVLLDGRIARAASPREILDEPGSLPVARLLGAFNLLPAEILSLDPARNRSRLKLASFELQGPYFPGKLIGDHVTLYIRPDQLSLTPRDGRPGPNHAPLDLLQTLSLPSGVRLEFSSGVAVEMKREDLEQWGKVKEWNVGFPADRLRVL